MTNPEDLLTGGSPWCVSCKHHVTEHDSRIVNYVMKADSTFDYYCEKCDCKEFDGGEKDKPCEHVAQDGVEFVES